MPIVEPSSSPSAPDPVTPGRRWEWPSWGTVFRSHLLDFCFPPVCPLCDIREREPGGESPLCAACRRQLLTDARQCARCSASVGPYVDASVDCVQCRGERFAFESAVSIGPYDQERRTACLRAKLAGGRPLVAGLVDCLWERHGARLVEWNPDLIIPVPHRWWERMTRHHLSPLSLAEGLAARLQRPASFDLLTKCRHTPKQALLAITNRRDNVRGSFQITGGGQLTGATVLLVDDVMTSGATAHECSRILKAAGAQRVHVAIIARVGR